MARGFDIIFHPNTTPAQHRAAAEAGRALTSHAITEAARRIAARQAGVTLIDALPQEVWETADETGIEAGEARPRRTQIDTDAMETDREA